MTKQYPYDREAKVLRNGEQLIQITNESNAIRKYLHAATSDNTRKAYRSAIRQFESWGGRLPSDQQTLVRYLLAKAEVLNTRTLDLHLTAIAQWHRYQGFRNPVDEPIVRKSMEGIRRTHGKPKKKAKALRLEHIGMIVDHLRHQGLVVHLPRSKTDQESAGTKRALPFGDKNVCPGTAIKAWLGQSKLTEGPLFRSINRWDQVGDKALNPSAVNEILKGLGVACNFEFVPDLSSHSFRRGLSTSAAREKVEFDLIKKQGGWKSDATVWGYIEEGQQLTDNATTPLMAKLNALIDQRPK